MAVFILLKCKLFRTDFHLHVDTVQEESCQYIFIGPCVPRSFIQRFHLGVVLKDYQRMSDARTVKKIFNWKPLTKDHKEDPSTDGRITSNRTFAK